MSVGPKRGVRPKPSTPPPLATPLSSVVEPFAWWHRGTLFESGADDEFLTLDLTVFLILFFSDSSLLLVQMKLLL